MTSVESNNEDCNCNVTFLEQPHCTGVRLIVLDLVDTLGETTSFAADNDCLTINHVLL